ncbi:MAG: hypothetical protein M3Y51_05060 [Actinomycetota bacterium]|nr:hypothetical protein [Actinomycetota bacterium]
MAFVVTTLLLLVVAGALVLRAVRKLEESSALLVSVDTGELRRAADVIDQSTDGLRREIRDRLGQ